MNLDVAIDVFSKEMRLTVRAVKAVDLCIVLWQSESQVSYINTWGGSAQKGKLRAT